LLNNPRYTVHQTIIEEEGRVIFYGMFFFFFPVWQSNVPDRLTHRKSVQSGTREQTVEEERSVKKKIRCLGLVVVVPQIQQTTTSNVLPMLKKRNSLRQAIFLLLPTKSLLKRTTTLENCLLLFFQSILTETTANRSRSAIRRGELNACLQEVNSNNYTNKRLPLSNCTQEYLAKLREDFD
jgi:hypothetical protein